MTQQQVKQCLISINNKPQLVNSHRLKGLWQTSPTALKRVSSNVKLHKNNVWSIKTFQNKLSNSITTLHQNSKTPLSYKWFQDYPSTNFISLFGEGPPIFKVHELCMSSVFKSSL